MAISLDKINSALDRLDNKGGSSQNQDNIVKLDEGEHQIRIAPYKEDLDIPRTLVSFPHRRAQILVSK